MFTLTASSPSVLLLPSFKTKGDFLTNFMEY
jgi:hypothetical protein